MMSLLKTIAHRAARATGVPSELNDLSLQMGQVNRDLSLKIDQANHVVPTIESTGASRGTQIELALKYRELWARGVRCAFDDVEFRNFSQNGEDGILWYIFSIIGTTNKKTVELCAGDGIQCNAANLIVNHGWDALLFDGAEENIKRGNDFYKSHPDTFFLGPKLLHAWVTSENVNTIIRQQNTEGEIDLLSLDMDGVDYWIWKAIDCIQPRVVALEYNWVWGHNKSMTIPYTPDFRWNYTTTDWPYYGASLPAFVKLAKEKGYRLVGSQRLGFNAFFVRSDVGVDALPEIPAARCFETPMQKRLNRQWSDVTTLMKPFKWVEV